MSAHAAPAPTAPAPQRVCPHCATVAHTAGRRCPSCGRSFRRHTLAGVAALLVVFTVIILGGVAAMLTAFGDELNRELDSQVTTVQRGFDDDLRSVQRTIRRELDRRLPDVPPAQP